MTIRACCILHNIFITRGDNYEGNNSSGDDDDDDDDNPNDRRDAPQQRDKDIRDALVQYIADA